MSRFVVFLAVLLAASGAHAADGWRATTEKLDAYFNALDTNHFANGVIIVSERGEVRYRRALGLAWRGDAPSANETSTLFKIGAVTKLLTATLSMQLVEGASITLDGPVAEFFPDLPNALQLTYRDLLRHRSGLADFTRRPDYETWRLAPHPRDEILARLATAGAHFAPRERVEYNNSNYLLMGYVLEKVREKPYDDILAQRISSKLGLARTVYGLTAKPANRMALSYKFTPNGWVADAQTDPELFGGAGGVISNAEDLVRIIEALFGGRLVSAQSLATMRSQEGGSGIGLWPYDVAGERGLGHGGAIESYRSCVFYFPDRGIAISYTGNGQLLAMAEIVDETLATVFDRGHRPRVYAPVKLATTQMAAYAGTWKSAPGAPADSPFREFRAADNPLSMKLAASPDGLVGTIGGHDFPLTAFGDDEFFLPLTGTFVRIHPRTNELIVRDADYAYYLRR
jgi:D-alanyl-D-alanine carboxypeptidase